MGGPTDHVSFQARLQPGRLAAADLASGRRLTYSDLDHAIARCAAVLAERGCGEGDRVAALAHNRVELMIAHLACARLGVIYVPLNWRLAAPELHALIEDAEPALIIGDQELARVGLAGVDLNDFAAEIEASRPLATGPFSPDRPSLILYTSGTTGRPKGAVLSEGALAKTAANFGRLGRVTHDSVFLNDSPMFHVIGLVTSIRTPLLHGGTVLVSNGFDPGRTLARMDDPDLTVTHYFCVPQMAAMLRAHPDYDPGKLRTLAGLFTGGAPHHEVAIRAWLLDGIPPVDGFGMSEAGTVFGMPLDLQEIEKRAGSAGIAAPSVSCRIVDAEGRERPSGAPGELLLRGPNLFSHYWRRPEETAQAFTEDGWFRTGDIVRADDEGFHWIVGRKKDMIISGGENIYPAEIENLLGGHPAIAESAVIGLPDPRWGEVGHLAVVLRSGASLTYAQVAAHLEGHLARFKIPKGMTILEEFPRTGSGKVKKADIRVQLMAREAGMSAAGLPAAGSQ